MNPLYKEALDKWGHEAMYIVAIEEMSELTKVLTKMFRAMKFGQTFKNGGKYLIGEIADVEIMTERIKQTYGITEKVEEVKEKKLERLKLILKNTEVKP